MLLLLLLEICVGICSCGKKDGVGRKGIWDMTRLELSDSFKFLCEVKEPPFIECGHQSRFAADRLADSIDFSFEFR